MKTLKSIFAAFAALFLAFFLSGCGDEDSKTASQGGSVSSSVFDSGGVKLVLRPGVKEVFFYFSDDAARSQQSEKIRAALEEQGIGVSEVVTTWDSGIYVAFAKSVVEQTSVRLDKAGLVGIDVKSSLGSVAKWDPAIGDEVRYAG